MASVLKVVQSPMGQGMDNEFLQSVININVRYAWRVVGKEFNAF